MSIDIDPRGTCECPRPLPDSTYFRLRVCKLCRYLIPRSRVHRLELEKQRKRIDAKEGLAPKIRPEVGMDFVRKQIVRWVDDDPSLTNHDLRVKAGSLYRFDCSKWSFERHCQEIRDELGIVTSKGLKGGVRVA